MRFLFLLLMLGLVPTVFGYGQPEPAPVVSDSDAQADGQALALELAVQRPETNSTITGWLNIRYPGRQSVRIQLQLEISVTSSNWQAFYETVNGGRSNTMLLKVRHSSSGPNVY